MLLYGLDSDQVLNTADMDTFGTGQSRVTGLIAHAAHQAGFLDVRLLDAIDKHFVEEVFATDLIPGQITSPLTLMAADQQIEWSVPLLNRSWKSSALTLPVTWIGPLHLSSPRLLSVQSCLRSPSRAVQSVRYHSMAFRGCGCVP